MSRKTRQRLQRAARNFSLFGLVLFVGGMLLFGRGMAQAAEFLASIDKTQGTTDDLFTLTLIVKDSEEVPADLNLPPLPEFEVQPQGRSSQTQCVNLSCSQQVSYTYILHPRQAGTLTIPHFTLNLEGQSYQTQPITLTVTPASAIPPEQKPIFVRQRIDPTTVYPGQQVFYVFEVFVQQGVQVVNLQFDAPTFTDMHVEELPQPPNAQQVINGRPFVVLALKRVLYPLKSGTLTITPASLRGQVLVAQGGGSPFDGFFNRSAAHPLSLTAEALTLNVQPLPPNAPAGFSGLVGQYAMEAQLSKTTLAAGDSTTLKITISGIGRAEAIPKPALALEGSLKTYDDQPVYKNEEQNGQMIGQAIFTTALVPAKAGTYQLPPVRFVFFDPQTAEYRTQEVPFAALNVSPGQEDPTTALNAPVAAVTKKKVEKLAEDLLPIHTELNALPSQAWNFRHSLGLGMLGLLPPLLFSLALGWRWRSEHSLANADKIRRQQAFNKWQKASKTWEKLSPGGDQIIAASVAFRQYIGDKANRHGTALTSQEIAEWLTAQHITEALVANARQLLEQSEAIQYAASALGPEVHTNFSTSLKTLVEQLEKQL